MDKHGAFRGPAKGEGMLLAGLLLIAAGLFLAWTTQTVDGISIHELRFDAQEAGTLSALLFVPPAATADTRAPGILAVHGYINSREAQSGFAIEFARRGYVVLALDQPGHGYSDPPAFAAGFGGPAALAQLRALPFVDPSQIGLEGHSMGGWAVLAAAAAEPAGYRALVLAGSSTGAPFAAEATPTWPRNLAVVFPAYDEFSTLMWGVAKAQQVTGSPKLKALFAAPDDVKPGVLYGNVEQGTARILVQPRVTHPGAHLSHAAIGAAVDWFQRTVPAPRPRPPSDQIWLRKEFGTLAALIGLVCLMLGTIGLVASPSYDRNAAKPGGRSHGSAGGEAAASRTGPLGWWTLLVFGAALPALTFYPLFSIGEQWLPATTLLPQSISNQVLCWVVGNALLALALQLWLKRRYDSRDEAEDRSAGAGPARSVSWLQAGYLALVVVGVAYAVVLTVGKTLQLDFRFWFVAFKPLSVAQLWIALTYLLPLCAYFLIALRGMHAALAGIYPGPRSMYLANAVFLCGGLALWLLAQYGVLFLTGQLLTPTQPLNTIIMIQFVPVLLMVAVLATYSYRLTACHRPGALICGLLVTWYLVAGQATHVA